MELNNQAVGGILVSTLAFGLLTTIVSCVSCTFSITTSRRINSMLAHISRRTRDIHQTMTLDEDPNTLAVARVLSV